MDENLIKEKIDKIRKIEAERHNATRGLFNARDEMQKTISQTLEPYNRELRQLEKELGDIYFLYDKSNLKDELEKLFYQIYRRSRIYGEDYDRGKYDGFLVAYKLFFTEDEVKYLIEISDKCIK